MTPNPPAVSCQENQLTITASNSTMGTVLAAVRACIGVQIDVPDSLADARTYLKLGPGPTRSVLDALLSSTEFNYVIQSSKIAPEKIQTILLIARSKDSNESKDGRGPSIASNLPMTPARRAWLASRNASRPTQPTAEEEDPHPSDNEPVAKIIPDRAAAPPADLAIGSNTGIDADLAKVPSKAEDIGANTSAPVGTEAHLSPDATSSPTAVATTDAAADNNPDSPAAKELQNKIGEMQQLFEQRKKMNTNASSGPGVIPGPSTNPN